MLPSLYIHIPFCAKKCAYCDFYSTAYSEALASSYVDALVRQINTIDGGVSTIFIGGGTPTALSAPLLRKLLRGVKRFSGDAVEFTVEANPESLDAEKLSIFFDEGVNRISIGAQSFDDKKLKKLGRIHDAKKAVGAVMLSKRKGFKNLSIDLIFGAPGETLDDCAAEFKRAIELPVAHISCYCLTYEKGTPLSEKKSKGWIVPVGEEFEAEMYSCAMEFLPKHGFGQYEVSNFARKGMYCRHNMNYWENNEYIGIGASAVSYIGGVRMKNTPDVKKYTSKVMGGASAVVFSERLNGERQAKETAALKIRTAEGINFNWFRKKTGRDFMELEADALPGLSAAGLIRYRKIGGKAVGISLTKKGFLLCDTVSSELV